MFRKTTKELPINIFSKLIGATLGLLLTVILTTPIQAQFRAAVQGSITDSAGATIAGATVILTNNETGRAQTSTTSDNGFYRFSGLAPSSYKISVEQQNFKKREIDNIDVAAEITQSVDVALEAGGIAEAVTITDQTPALQTENANVQGSVTEQQVRALPQAGRNPYELLRLTPGVFGDSARSGTGQAVNLPNSPGPGGSNSSIFQSENQVPITASGQRVTANNYQVDGVSTNSLQYGGATVLTPNQESVKEVVVSSSSFSAEDGRNSGAQVKIISQNGTNTFHGSATFKYDDPGWNAFNKFYGNSVRPASPSRVENRDKQFAGSFGGRIIKNKLFFFASYEGLRNNTNNTYDTFIETSQYRQQVIAARPNSTTARIFQVSGIEPRLVTTLPRTCADVFGGDAANRCRNVNGGLDLGSITGTRNVYLPLGNGVGNANIGGGFDGVPDVTFARFENPQQRRGNQYNARIDYNLNAKNQLAFSTFVTRQNNSGADASSGSRLSSDLVDQPLNYIVTGLWINNLSSSLINEFRGNFTRFHSDQVKAAQDTNFGVPRVEVEGLPFSRIRFGAPQGETTPAIFSQNTLEFRDSLTQVYGSHVLKYGAEYRREFDNNELSGGSRPLYSFVGLFNLANDTPIFEQINADPRTGAPANAQRFFRTNNYAIFLQDDWKAKPNLTLNLGLRYEYLSPLTETENRITNLILGTGANVLTDARAVNVKTLNKPDRNNFGPRIGFAYSPSFNKLFGSNFLGENKMVIRGGFGLYYNRIQNAVFSNSRGNPPAFARYGICCGTASTDFGTPFVGGRIIYTLGSSNSVNSYPANPVLGQGVNANGLPIGAAAEFYGSQADVPNAEVYKYSLEVQYQLPYKLVTSLGYEGNQSRHLVRLIDLNLFYPQTNSGISAARFVSPDVNANFNGLNARIERRFSNGFQVAANYRFAKSLDTLSNEGPGAETNQTYPIDQSQEKGPSDYDVRHNLVATGVWELPIFRNRKDLVGKLVGGWEISSIVSAHTGLPWTPKVEQFIRSVSGQFFGPIRPIAYFGGVQQDTSNDSFLRPNGYFTGGGSRYFSTVVNIDPVLVQPTYQRNPPGIGRNSFRGPNYFSVDASVAKNFGLPKIGFLGESSGLELKFNFFNLFNRLNLTPFSYYSSGVFVNRPDFGEPGSALAGRTVEFQARFRF